MSFMQILDIQLITLAILSLFYFYLPFLKSHVQYYLQATAWHD